ncbi:MAG: hypothetical protein UY24_C0015G0005 [Parcubacteria group bacterium GW2011_GWA1_48_11b]|nr:MAG: hypothetical protein UX74_C0001G0022 [Parcubacteria group bacterium GW2011_GWA2_47_10b]KKU94414.1 MAG: hypothetical protein UY24_C0015G0005 [Parcubacteria group bacterium GW2011_GWA1_48_11b]
MGENLLRGRELHPRPSGYEPDELLLLYPAENSIHKNAPLGKNLALLKNPKWRSWVLCKRRFEAFCKIQKRIIAKALADKLDSDGKIFNFSERN